jgi:hypothetical protein
LTRQPGCLEAKKQRSKEAKKQRSKEAKKQRSKEAGRVGVRLLLAKNFASARFFTCTCGTIYAKVKLTLKLAF